MRGLWALGLCGCLALAACRERPLGVPVEGERYRALTVAQAERLVGKPGVHVFDANLQWYLTGQVPTAVPLFYEDVTAKTLPADKGATLVFYCRDAG